jgi:peptide/nickel transport system permease protein
MSDLSRHSPATRLLSARLPPLLPLVAVVVLASVVLITILAPLLGLDPYKQDLLGMLSPPSPTHPFGTDMLGRDMFARVVWGGAPPLFVGCAAVVVAMILGVSLGLLAGYKQGILDAVLSRIADVQMSIPGLILALLILVLFGASITNLIIVIALESWTLHFRVVRSQVMTVRNLAYIEAARLAGIGRLAIILRHIAPSALPILAVTGTANFSHALLMEAALSFLGIGVQPPTPDWGMMVSEGQGQLSGAWWIAIFPGVALVVVMWCAQIIGDWLSDRFSVRGDGLQ